MKKIFLSLFLFLFLFSIFPKTETFAVTCPSGEFAVCPPASNPEYTIVQGSACRKPATSDWREPDDCTTTAPPPAANPLPAVPGVSIPGAPPVSTTNATTGNATAPTGCDPAKGPCTSGSGKPCTEGTSRGIATAIGCIPTEPGELVNGLLRYGTFAAGGIAFLLMLLASLEMITAEGSAEVIKHAQEKFYSAIIGLLLIIFSVLLMQVIGVDVLDLPGFVR